jgi:hypothetical protein
VSKKTILLLIATFLAGMLAGGSYQLDKQKKVAAALQESPGLLAWDDFTRRMNELGHRLLAKDSATVLSGGAFPMDSDRDRSEGVRQLAHMVVEGLRLEFDHADAEFPSLMVINTDTTGWGGPNVDNKYIRAKIQGGNTYRLSGNLDGVRDIAIQTSLGDLHMGEIGSSETLDKSALTVDAQGRFSLTISPRRQEGDWMPLAEDHTNLSIRVYLADWANDAGGEFYLIKVGNEGLSPQILTEEVVAQRLDNAASWIEGSLIGWNRWMKAALITDKVNEANGVRSVGGGSSNMLYGGIPFDLNQDEAMVIEVTPPTVAYWSFQTYTHAWFDAGDYAHRTTSINMEQAHLSPDGRVWLVLAHEDPGVPNWLDTEGRQEAIITHRWMMAEGEPELRVKVVQFSDLHDHLPAKIPRVNAEERRNQIEIRQRHVQHRFHN